MYVALSFLRTHWKPLNLRKIGKWDGISCLLPCSSTISTLIPADHLHDLQVANHSQTCPEDTATMLDPQGDPSNGGKAEVMLEDTLSRSHLRAIVIGHCYERNPSGLEKSKTSKYNTKSTFTTYPFFTLCLPSLCFSPHDQDKMRQESSL